MLNCTKKTKGNINSSTTKNGAINLYITKDKPVKGYTEWQKRECVSNSAKEIETDAASNDNKILYQLNKIF